MEVGLYDSERAQILSGLTGEEMVISTWSSQLYEGSTVKLKGDADSENVPDGQGQAEKSAAPESGRKPDGGAPDGRHGGQGGAPGQNQ